MNEAQMLQAVYRAAQEVLESASPDPDEGGLCLVGVDALQELAVAVARCRAAGRG